MPRNLSLNPARLIISVVLLLGLVMPLGSASATVVVRYAKPKGKNGGSCLSWSSACSLQRALTVARGGNQIWAMRGKYVPTLATNAFYPRSKTFQLKSGVAIYGGFAGTETSITQRNIKRYPSILTGDPGTPLDPTDNAYHVVTGSGVNSKAILDGFTITLGNANEDVSLSYIYPHGGGIFIVGGSPTLRNLTISANMAGNFGGGIYVRSGNPSLSKVAFKSNRAGTSGGGMYNDHANSVLRSVQFVSNQAIGTGGGGMFNNGSSPRLTTVSFVANTAAGEGGGMENAYSPPSPFGLPQLPSNAVLSGVTFAGNSAANGGGMSNETSSPVLTNVTFNGNTASSTGEGGGGMYNNSSAPTITNATFVNNSTPAHGGGMYNNNNSNPRVTNATFYANKATGAAGQGGGMANQSSSPTLNNVTFSGNTADTVNFGDGMYNSDIASNPVGPIIISNTILWNDGDEEIINDTVVPPTLSITNAVIKGATSATDCLGDGRATCTHIITTSPVLGILKNNGGSTQTMALGAGSSAIDKGGGYGAVCAPKDQRGVTRPQGRACDIGAYEKK